MKPILTKDEIQFIDNYLKNSDVNFDDIRMEMVDHVASEVELRMEQSGEEFHEVFKLYMDENKKSLLNKCNRNYRRKDRKLLRQLVANVFSLTGVLIAVGSYFVLKYFSWPMSTGSVRIYSYTVVIFCCLVYFLVSKKTGFRFSAVERLGGYLVLYYFLASLISFVCRSVYGKDFSDSNAIWLMLIVVASPVFLVQLGVQVFRGYYKRYKVLA